MKGCCRTGVDKDGKTCEIKTVNLYDVVKYHVNPATCKKQCSYVELVAPVGTRAQTPNWFVSHWWGEPVMDFIACVEEHARVRALDPQEAVYWVCLQMQKLQECNQPENFSLSRQSSSPLKKKKTRDRVGTTIVRVIQIFNPHSDHPRTFGFCRVDNSWWSLQDC